MNEVEIVLRILAGLLLVLANGFFVAIEFALTRARQYPASEFDVPGLRRAWEMTQDLEIYLTSCQVGITASSIALGIVAEPAIAAVFEPVFHATILSSIGAGGIVAFVVINLVHLTHGEQTPTYLGVERTKFVARYGATPLYWFSRLLSPVIYVGDHVAKWTLHLFDIEMTGAWLDVETDVIESRADLRNRLGSLLDRADLTAERRTEILNALEVGDRPVGDVMTPVDSVVSLETGSPVEDTIDRIGSSPHTRFPLVGDDHTDFRGIVYVPTVVDHIDELRSSAVTFEDIAAPPMTIEADTAISDAVDQFQSERQELALVTEDDAVVGLITATDALQAIVGTVQHPRTPDAGRRA